MGCPISRIAVPDFIKVQEQFANESMSFVMFNSSIQDSIKRISSEVDEFNIPFTVLKDADQSLGKALGIERTAEIFVIDTSTKQTVYRGPINDKLGYETQKNNASKNYLADALNATLAGESFNLDNIPEMIIGAKTAKLETVVTFMLALVVTSPVVLAAIAVI